MAVTLASWRRLNLSNEDDQFRNERAIACFLGKNHHYSKGRNAYWGIWTEEYVGDSSFSPDMEVLRESIEGQRTQGSTFTLSDVPALVLWGKKQALVICHLRQPPFEGMDPRKLRGKSLRELATSIENGVPATVTTFVAAQDLPLLAALPFRTFKSRSEGAARQLLWDQER